MLSFTRDKTKRKECQLLLTRIMNLNNPHLAALREGPRCETRMDLTMVVLVAGFDSRGRLDLDNVHGTVTKEVSTSGMAIVLHEPIDAEEVCLAFAIEGETKYVRAKVCHQRQMGGGLFQLGTQFKTMIDANDYNGLDQLQV